VYFYSQLVFSSRLLNDTVIIDYNAASGDRVINDAKKKLCKKASMTECTTATYAWRNWVEARKPIVSTAGDLCEFQATKYQIPVRNLTSTPSCRSAEVTVTNTKSVHFRAVIGDNEPRCSYNELPYYKMLLGCRATGEQIVMFCIKGRRVVSLTPQQLYFWQKTFVTHRIGWWLGSKTRTLYHRRTLRHWPQDTKHLQTNTT
jgi:hypothetical protein